MDIFLDSNILIADPWLRSQKLRMLMDFAEKSFSKILLLKPVEMEVRSHFKRRSASIIAGIENAIKTAERNHLKGLPNYDCADSLIATMKEWESNFEQFIRKNEILRVAIDNSVLLEALRRSAERIPPCSESGNELRDTVIWLSLLSCCKMRVFGQVNVFISENVRDFASPDKLSLRTELVEDLKREKLELLYYPSLDSFLEEHAKKFEHITVEWVRDHIDLNELKKAMRQCLTKVNERFFTISDPSFRDYYTAWYVEGILSVTTDITGPIYIWEFNEDHIELSIGCGVDVEADIECTRTTDLKSYDLYDDYYPQYRTLRCKAELGADIAAKVKDDNLEIISIEDVYSI